MKDIELTNKVENNRIEAGKCSEQVNPSMCDNLRLKTDLEAQAYGIICNSHRTSMRELGFNLNLNSREVRKLIENMRRSGIRIGYDFDGYYLCRNDREFNEFLTRYMAGAMSRLEIASAMKHNNNGQVFTHYE